jgi:hypothetical protein
MKKLLFRISMVSLTGILGGGCAVPIQVKDFGAYWNKGTIDPGLEGSWNGSWIQSEPNRMGEVFLTYTKKGDHYLLKVITVEGQMPEVEIEVKSIKLNQYSFGMLKCHEKNTKAVKGKKSQKPEESNQLERYSIEKDTLNIYVLNSKKKAKGVDGKVVNTENENKVLPAGISEESGKLVLSKLDEPAITYLIKLSGDSNRWTTIPFTRVRDLKKAMEEFRRQHPTTQDTKS